MKKEDKIIQNRLFLKRIPTSMLETDTYVGRSDKPFEESEEYISLSKGWHSVKEEPEDEEAIIILVNADFENPTVCDLDVFSSFCEKTPSFSGKDEDMWKEATMEFQGGYWAYFKDFIPTIKKGGAK